MFLSEWLESVKNAKPYKTNYTQKYTLSVHTKP